MDNLPKTQTWEGAVHTAEGRAQQICTSSISVPPHVPTSVAQVFQSNTLGNEAQRATITLLQQNLLIHPLSTAVGMFLIGFICFVVCPTYRAAAKNLSQGNLAPFSHLHLLFIIAFSASREVQQEQIHPTHLQPRAASHTHTAMLPTWTFVSCD